MKIILGFITILSIIIVGLFSLNKDEGEIFLIPENYIGTVVVVFNLPDGKPPKYEGKIRLYEIDENGILLTQFKENIDIKPVNNVKYYYYNKKTKKKTAIVYLDKDQLKYYIGNSNFAFSKTMESGLSNRDYREYKYLHFIIGNVKAADSLYDYRERSHLPNMIDKLCN